MMPSAPQLGAAAEPARIEAIVGAPVDETLFAALLAAGLPAETAAGDMKVETIVSNSDPAEAEPSALADQLLPLIDLQVNASVAVAAVSPAAREYVAEPASIAARPPDLPAVRAGGQAIQAGLQSPSSVQPAVPAASEPVADSPIDTDGAGPRAGSRLKGETQAPRAPRSEEGERSPAAGEAANSALALRTASGGTTVEGRPALKAGAQAESMSSERSAPAAVGERPAAPPMAERWPPRPAGAAPVQAAGEETSSPAEPKLSASALRPLVKPTAEARSAVAPIVLHAQPRAESGSVPSETPAPVQMVSAKPGQVTAAMPAAAPVLPPDQLAVELSASTIRKQPAVSSKPALSSAGEAKAAATLAQRDAPRPPSAERPVLPIMRDAPAPPLPQAAEEVVREAPPAPVQPLSPTGSAIAVHEARAMPTVAEALAARTLDLVRDGAWVEQLARDIGRAAAGDGVMRLRLAPETLGDLRIEIQQGERGLNLRMTTSSEQAQAALAEAQPRLLAEARAQGLRLTEAQIDLAGSQQQGREAARQHQRAPEPEPASRLSRHAQAHHHQPNAPRLRRSADRYA